MLEPTPAASPIVVFAIFQTGSRANGGVESITQIIERCRLQPIVVTQRETAVNSRWTQAGAEVKVWQTWIDSYLKAPVLQKLLSFLLTNWQMFRLLRETGCTVLHCNDIGALWQTAIGAKLASAKVVFNIRSTKPAQQNYSFKWSLALRLSDRQIVLSQEMRELLIQRLALSPQQQARITSIYSVVDPLKLYPVEANERQEIRDRLQISADCYALGYVAMVRPVKAQLEFIQKAVPLLKQTVPQLKLYFIGDFEPNHNCYAADCYAAVQQLDLTETIEFVGYRADVADWYRALDSVVLASQEEGLARCMIESLACGTPVVSFDVCSAREILEGYDCGRVVAQADYAALAKAIALLAQHPALHQVLAKNGIQAAKALFQPDAVVQQYEAVYRTLANGDRVRSNLAGRLKIPCPFQSPFSRF